MRSTASPLRIRSHWEEGIPGGDLGAILIKNFAFEMSRLYARSNRQIPSQLGLLRMEESLVGSYHGMSDSSNLGFFVGLSSSSSESDPVDS